MKIGGLLKFSLIDYPYKISAVIFTQGCNFRCPFCHNPELVLPRRFQLPISVEDILSFLKMRFGKLDGVVITGGEPFFHDDISELIQRIKEIGYSIKLDTNGSRPARLSDLIRSKLIDYIALDIKAAPVNYSKVTGVPVNVDYIMKSIELIRESGLPYEFRTTIVKNLHETEEFNELAELLHPEDSYILQNFTPSKRVGAKELPLAPFEKKELKEILDIFQAKGIYAKLR